MEESNKLKILFAHPALSIDEAESFVKAQYYNLPYEMIFLGVKSKTDIYYEGEKITAIGNFNRITNRVSRQIKRINFSDAQYKENLKYLESFGADLILAQYGTTGMYMLDYAKDLNVKLVVHFHGFDSGIKKVLLRNDNYKELWRQANAVIAVSNKMYRQLSNLGAPESILHYNCYGIDTTKFKLKSAYQGKDIVAIGRFTEKKAPQILLYTFSLVLKQVPDARLIIAGNGVLFDPCVKLAQALKISDSIVFLGATSHETVAEYMQNALVFAQHSIVPENGDTEGTPLAVMEAMCSGLPVVSTRHAGIMDVVKEGETGFLVDELDAEGMANHLIFLLQNPDKCREMGVKGSEFIKNTNSLERYITDLDKIIKQSMMLD